MAKQTTPKRMAVTPEEAELIHHFRQCGNKDRAWLKALATRRSTNDIPDTPLFVILGRSTVSAGRSQ
jgi:hypothetical protein